MVHVQKVTNQKANFVNETFFSSFMAEVMKRYIEVTGKGLRTSIFIVMFKSFLVLTAAAASLVAASDRVSVKGYTADAKGSLDCKFGSGDILKKCGTCAQSITECATSNPNKTEEICVSEIGSFAGDCGGCAVDILECL